MPTFLPISPFDIALLLRSAFREIAPPRRGRGLPAGGDPEVRRGCKRPHQKAGAGGYHGARGGASLGRSSVSRGDLAFHGWATPRLAARIRAPFLRTRSLGPPRDLRAAAVRQPTSSSSPLGA